LEFNPQNILIIDFGQIGDVILSLPALKAVREKFPNARVTVMIGKASADIIEISDFVDEKIAVNRAELRRSNTFWSIWQIFKLVAEVRRRKFDLVIDLHSLYETNLLGFLSGAKHRLFSNRETRSLDSLSNFRPKPPLFDRAKHLTDYYLDTLKPLGIENAGRFVQIKPRSADYEKTENLLQNIKGKNLVGIFPGAGHVSRRWGLDNYAELAKRLSADKDLQIIVFLGPEEKNLRAEIEGEFPAEAIIFDNLTLLEFAAALSCLQLLISNDTGAIHIGAVVGTSILVVMDERAPVTYLPLTEKIRAVRSRYLEEIAVGEVFDAAQNFLSAHEVSSNEIKKNHQSHTN
jgi:ADP-heptose:LPS heptosyltransferase